MDIKETDQDYFWRRNFPACPERIYAQLVEATLEGERKRPVTEGSEKTFAWMFHGSFTRKFSLPAEVESGAIKAEFNKGLRMRVPKKSKPQPQEIDVDVMSCALLMT